MSQDFRKAAFRTPTPPAATAIGENPAARLEQMYLHIWATSMHDLPFVNPALSVEAVGFRRWRTADLAAHGSTPLRPALLADDAGNAAGDWVGAVITPWFINLFLLPGGGNLWSDRASGERCHIDFPIGPLEFIADYNAAAEVPAYQYCPLFAPPSQFVSQSAARAAARAALDTMLHPPCAEDAEPHATNDAASTCRRAFFRRVAKR